MARALAEVEETLVTQVPLDPAAAPEQLARVVQARLRRALESVGGDPEARRAAQVTLVNRVLGLLHELSRETVLPEDAIAEPGRRLLEVAEPRRQNLGRVEATTRPRIGLATSDLLVNGPHDLRVGLELRRELASADRVDLLCSFLKWSGLRVVEAELRDVLDRRPGCVRVLTTAYMGATERRTLDRLAELGAQVRVSYDTDKTRLHAKAWLFFRETGFSTCFVGSSNLSAAALLDGLEWNVRVSRADNPGILDKFAACFEQYWSEAEFEPYEPERDGQRYDAAVKRQRSDQTRLHLSLDVTPRAHQAEILEALEAEREAGHHKNLVVAATGTGKTVVAALDYRRIAKDLGGASLLFVAHRREILKQSLATFQVVMRDGGFGELLVEGMTPGAAQHVFASIQSLSKERIAAFAPDAYDVVIVDEFHHAAAPTYQRLLEHVRPKYLIGLTATPERADGLSIMSWFEDRIAAELRLWQALDLGLLAPFQYFGLAGPDLQGVRWSRGRYDVDALSNVYTADDVFLTRVLQELHAKVADIGAMRALGFCVDKAHARFMAHRFNEAGIAAEAITSDTPATDREAALLRLRRGELRVVFSVDLFNEGVDLPTVDTLLFLRPTESATLFIQQLGRGLRRAEGKACCTVLDFVGHAHRSFRFDLRFRALIGGTRRAIMRAVEGGFPRLPAGCEVQLDRVAQEAVLTNLRQTLGAGRAALAEDLRALGDVPLGTYLRETGLALEDVYDQSGHSFTELRRKAGFATTAGDETMERALARMLHVDDPVRLGAFGELLASPTPPRGDPADPAQRLLFVLLGQRGRPYAELDEAWATLWRASDLRTELQDLLQLLADRRRNLVLPVDGPLQGLPLCIHATYSLDEVMAAFDARTKRGGALRLQAGVYEARPYKTDVLFVTLEKQERDYSPTTLYRDYPLSDRRFHWESQSSCHEDTPAGRRYQAVRRGSERRVLLFMRSRRKDERGESMPYLLLGPAWYVGHEGGRPMQIEWALEHAIPSATYQQIKVAAG
ncbi:MAG: DUF3427 domain-containing protein [Alphaproteobacteria bacterium]|nr:DUF3427 domain-containing protein [Alphaproteobacteria bacterium]MCB9746588.1 DUF3427 domain-containing protein [Alphaproteobacteria bacterium]